MAITASKIGMAIDQAVIEEACQRLLATGPFASVEYTFRPARPLVNAAINIPGADEWMVSLYPASTTRFRLARRISSPGRLSGKR